MNQLEQLRKFTTVVADTSDFQGIQILAPQDATTNPSLILRAAQKSEYLPLLKKLIQNNPGLSAAALIDPLIVSFGCEILKLIPGRVSTEIDARLSFDTQACVKKARDIIGLYEANGVRRDRVLIKIASTWEGIEAARILEQEGIHCNLTLLFCLVQAVACAQAKITLISPFVGRIYDWHKKTQGGDFVGEADPGVQSVKRIYCYLRKFGYSTEVMGASFRNTSQIIELSGCDLLTITPELLKKLGESEEPLVRKICPETAQSSKLEKLELNEAHFRFLLNDDAMATEKLAEGIRLFCSDTVKLEQLLIAHV